MASDLNKKKRTAGRGSAIVNTPGVKPPATVPEDRVEILRHLPQKKGATIVPPPGSGSASSPETAGGAYNAVGSYGAAGGDEAKESVSAVSPEVPAREEAASFRAPEADRAAQLRYDSALAALERKQGEAPHYDSRYDEQIRQLYEQITGRRPFRYDSATDPLYQQYAQRYTEQGAQAMRDTMGRAAALTGGYGSSYAQSVGQQQFDAYLRRLADVLPQTYGMALDAYRAEGDELQRRYERRAIMSAISIRWGSITGIWRSPMRTWTTRERRCAMATRQPTAVRWTTITAAWPRTSWLTAAARTPMSGW